MTLLSGARRRSLLWNHFKATNDRWRADAIAQIRSGEKTLCQSVREQIDDEYEAQNHLANETGSCSFGCSHQELIENENGSVVCRWTRRPCKSQAITKIIQLYSQINNNALREKH